MAAHFRARSLRACQSSGAVPVEEARARSAQDHRLLLDDAGPRLAPCRAGPDLEAGETGNDEAQRSN